ncbi:MAG TPA: hypothetical protein VNA69_02505 [Thermoanaerobaculia bacterium]|nr:hypothetical protein [Thermoanaerobaculia bacterium]
MSDIPPTVPPPPSPPSTGGAAPGSDRTLMVVLSYLWILFLVPLLTKKDDADVMWHAKNGMGITIGEVIAWVVYWVITYFAPSVVACAASVLSCVIGLGFFVLRIICIVKGINRQRFSVPVLTDMGQKINI